MKWSTHVLLGALLAISLSASAREAAAVTNIDSCRTITQSGSYRLTKNLHAKGDCLIVDADFVTIDLNGHTITGNGTGNGVGDDFFQQGRRGIVVRNGTIANFQSGVSLAFSEGCIVEQLRVFDNKFDGISAGTGSIVRGNIAIGNVNGFRLSSGTTMTGNTARDNTDGIEITCPSNVIGNTATGNTRNLLEFGSFCNLRDNVAQ